MKKLLLLLFAFMASLSGAWAQDVNLAQGVTVNSSGLGDGTGIDNIVDGDISTAYGDGKQYGVNTGWTLVFNLGSVKTVNSLKINFSNNVKPTTFTMYSSTDNSNWTEIGTFNTEFTGSTPNVSSYSAEFSSPVTAQYFKYECSKVNTTNSDWGYAISEFQLIQFVPSAQIPPSAPDAGVQQAALFTLDGTASAGTTAWANYDLGSATITDILCGGKTVKNIENSGKLFFNNSALTANINERFQNNGAGGKGYVTLSLDMYAATAQSGNLIIVEPVYNSGTETWTNNEHSTVINLPAGEWTTIRVSVKDFDYIGNIRIQMNKVSSDPDVYPNFRIANLYFISTEVEDPFSISVSDNIATITGNVYASNVAAINTADAMLIDMSGIVAIKEPISLSPHNPNAIVRVAGTVTAGEATQDATFDALTVPNKVVITEWVFPVGKLQITDANGAKYWDGQGCANNWVATSTRGWQISREIAANATVTACYPAAVATIPDGLKVYEFTGYESNTITMTSVTSMAANTPYIIMNTTDAAVDLVVEGTGDFSISTTKATPGNVEKGGATFHGNYRDLTSNGTQYILKGNEVKKANGAKIGSFRAYFTGVTAASARAIFDDGVTGINNIQNVEKMLNGKFYNLQGQEVKNPTKGIYIVNGKKVIIK